MLTRCIVYCIILDVKPNIRGRKPDAKKKYLSLLFVFILVCSIVVAASVCADSDTLTTDITLPCFSGYI